MDWATARPCAKGEEPQMAGRVGWLRIVAAVALAAGLSGCGLLPSADNSATLRKEAEADLARWDAALASGGGQSAFVPVGELTAQVGDWESSVGDNNKIALMSGQVDATVSLPSDTPPDGEVRWQDDSTETVGLISAQQALSQLKADGGGSCARCVRLQITAARLTSGTVETSRGPAVAPLWEFSLQGTAVRLTRLAIADRAAPVLASSDPNNPGVGISIESATASAAGKRLTVTFGGAPAPGDGGCGADYTAEAVESSNAVVVIVIEHRQNGGFGACTAVGAIRTADVELSAPLGKRVLLEVREGLPVAVTLTH